MAVTKYFNETIFPYTNNCQTLDAQISRLRSDYADVVSKKMKGNANKVDDLLTDKEIQFAKLFCEQKLADESVCIGSHQPANSYLNIPALLSAIDLTNAEAVHPGYGFLSENANFAKILEENKIKFIGASAKHI